MGAFKTLWRHKGTTVKSTSYVPALTFPRLWFLRHPIQSSNLSGQLVYTTLGSLFQQGGAPATLYIHI